MKLTVVGGGGFRVPQIFQAISAESARLRVDELWLYDTSAQRLEVIGHVLAQLGTGLSHLPRVHTTSDLDEALIDADFVFSAIRVGGTVGRITDELTALRRGVLGQETVGPGGLAYALRTVPHAESLARRIACRAPRAWTINFTNPAGILTEAMRPVLGSRVVSICDTPIGLMRRLARAVGKDPQEMQFDYVGLNHLGWLRTLEVDGHNILPEVLASDETLNAVEEARLFGFDWVRALGAIPNEYLFYYYLQREAMERLSSGEPTRGEFLDAQQAEFYQRAAAEPERAARLWHSARHQREASYMGEARPSEERYARRSEDVEGGGYQEVALDLMTGLATGEADTMILGVGNDTRGTDGVLIPQLPADAVVEVPCSVDRDGVHPHAVAPVNGEMAGLITTVKASEQLLLRALRDGSRELAWRAFSNHPLVDSTAVAWQLLEEYCKAMPDVAERLR